MDISLFLTLAKTYEEHGHKLYMVGGATRDYLLGRAFEDFDLVTDALPEESLRFLLEGVDKTFMRFGVLKYHGPLGKCDIATLREEGPYLDHRHPSYVRFVKDPHLDSKRRDFTVNALYLTPEKKVLDYHKGLEDLKKKEIRFIGDPSLRIKEDPLRICRAERFAESLGFSLEEKTLEAVNALRPLLSELNPAKIAEERHKGWHGLL